MNQETFSKTSLLLKNIEKIPSQICLDFFFESQIPDLAKEISGFYTVPNSEP